MNSYSNNIAGEMKRECPVCGRPIPQGLGSCPVCGFVPPEDDPPKPADLKTMPRPEKTALMALQCGLLGTIAWFYPLVGITVGVFGLMYARRAGRCRISRIAGWLCVYCIAASLLNWITGIL